LENCLNDKRRHIKVSLELEKDDATFEELINEFIEVYNETLELEKAYIELKNKKQDKD
jgi:hypothetical protein